MTGGWMPRAIRPAVWIVAEALAAGLALMVLNGGALGAFIALFVSRGLGYEAVGWLMIHGTTELFAIVLAGASGFSIGWAVTFPGARRRVDAAAEAGRRVVIADTTAVMVAVYSAMLFADGSLLQFALQRQRSYHATLVTGLDLPWVADGLQRDGPHVREPVDALVREALGKAGVPYRVVYGSGPERVRNALAAIDALPAPPGLPQRSWKWTCEKCSDPDCEHRLFTGLVRQGRAVTASGTSSGAGRSRR